MAHKDMNEILVPLPVHGSKRGYEEIKSPDSKKEKKRTCTKNGNIRRMGKRPCLCK